MINLKSTSPKYNPFVPEKNLRPKCEHLGCSDPKVIWSVSTVSYTPLYSKWCRKHHNIKYYNGEPSINSTAKKLGLPTWKYVERAALIRGFNSYNEYEKWLKSKPKQALPTIKDVIFTEISARSRVTTAK
jgi:hypothetical protein